MSNIRHTNYKRLDAKLDYSGLYDFGLVFNDDFNICNNNEYDDYNHICLITWFDFDKSFIYQDNIKDSEHSNIIHSIRYWENKQVSSEDIVIPNYGLTGMDNGAVKISLLPLYNCIDDHYSELYQKLTNSNLEISGSKKNHFFLTKVSTYDEFDMDITIERSDLFPKVGDFAVFKGGFYQGFYKLNGYDYQTLPNRYENGFVINLWVYKSDNFLTGEENLINDKYPNNKGFFLYFGTRAENKFWSEFKGNNKSCDPTNDMKFFTNEKEFSYQIETSEGLSTLNENIVPKRVIENQFLIYGRGNGKSDGLGQYSVQELKGIKSISVDTLKKPIGLPSNPFLLFGRGNGTTDCCPCDTEISERQWTACDKKQLENTTEEYTKDVNADLVDNAFGFRVTDLGQIQYRYITKNEKGEIIVREDQTSESIVLDDEWTNITLRWVPDNYIDSTVDCDETKNRFGKLMIYINCYLKYTFRDFPEIIGKKLNEIKEKQLGVPYNISLGGGSLGLMKHLTFDGPDENDLNLEIEKNFAGTFIGAISQFKIYDCDLTWNHIKNFCKTDGPRYSVDKGFMIQEHTPEEFYIYIEDYGKIKL